MTGLRHAFSTLGLNKLVVTLSEDSFDLLPVRVHDTLRPAGVRRQHEFRGGRLVDVDHSALFAEDWLVVSKRFIRSEEELS